MMEVDKKKTRTDEAWVRLYARFETDCLLPADAEHASATHRRLYLKWGSVSAAVIAGIVCFAAWWAVPEQGGDSRSLLTEENREKPTLVKTLEDGSVVYLAQESTLKYPEHFAEDKREVNLQGEAFFDVAKKPEQAFTIETARVRVEVLGTAFNVRSNEGAFTSTIRLSSSNCFWSITEGASSITSRPELFFGNAMQSRILSRPAKILTQRSRP